MSDQISSGMGAIGNSNVAQVLVPLAMGAASLFAPRAAHGLIGGMEMMSKLGERSRRQEAMRNISELLKTAEASGVPASRAAIMEAGKGSPDVGLHAATSLYHEPRFMSGPGGAVYTPTPGAGGNYTLKEVMRGRSPEDLAATELFGDNAPGWEYDPTRVKRVQGRVAERKAEEAAAHTKATGDVHYGQQMQYGPQIAAGNAAAVEPIQTQGAINRATAIAPVEMKQFKEKQAITAESKETSLTTANNITGVLIPRLQKGLQEIQNQGMMEGVPGAPSKEEVAKQADRIKKQIDGLAKMATSIYEKHGVGVGASEEAPAATAPSSAPNGGGRVLVPGAKTKAGGPVYRDNAGKYWSTAQ